jgi:hypothetical protein
LAMAERAYLDPDDSGRFYLRVGGQLRTYQVEGPDDRGDYWLCEILPVPAELEEIFARADALPERLIRRRDRG